MQTDNLFKPVEGGNISEKIAVQIETAILSGKIKPGNRLSSERELQNVFQVGRGAIREALQALKQKGIIEIKKGVKGGAYAKKIGIGSASESLSLLLKQNMVPLENLVEFRDTIDQSEVILASIRGDKEEKEKLVEMSLHLLDLNSRSDDPDVEKIKAIDRKMNLLLARMTKNPIFEWIKSTIQLSIGSYDSLLYEDPNYRSKTITNWINTAKEIAAGEPLKAISFCAYHYVLLQRCLKDKSLGETDSDGVKEN
ncbi:FadR/GntR family transcriptional regulator [Desulfospira joergensenii]|uniref:FadR/GntR family transcriptional regulator n=1 Tax=Desulfospira joergensenii TaxID=53329 RepID=UPI0003B76CE2|nr:GntR family transcriptional regulator [Desulfospira joergensenii]